jgi:tRNA(Ile)-lysidine synthetase-like protein
MADMALNANSIAESLPPGPWAVGVSGGADSVALLLLLKELPRVELHVVHLDHQTRGQESTADAAFVADLAQQLSIPAIIRRRDQFEPEMPDLSKNPSARYRAIRFELFRRVVLSNKLMGVILGHHADDQAETILFRLLRGSGPAGLAGMKAKGTVAGITVLRPLLDVRRTELREYLKQRGQIWREDASNQSDRYARNRVRRFLQSRQDLHDPIIFLGNACAEFNRWVRATAPKLEPRFPATRLAKLPAVLGRESARRWLITQGAAAGELSGDALDRLREMAGDAATPSRQIFPGNLFVHRRAGWISL